MNELREIVVSSDNKLIIELPKGFKNNAEYEVIIIPREDRQQKLHRFFDLAGKIDIDEEAVRQLRDGSMI
jgi:hypothetical protein